MVDHHIHGRIPLIVAQQTAYVWDVDDIATLRSEHHICGILSGTLPRLSQQNVFLGVPLVLMPEEVVYLVEKDVVVLVKDSSAYPSIAVDTLQHWISEQEDAFNRRLAVTHANGLKEGVAEDFTTSEEVQKKQQERRAKQRLNCTISDPGEDNTASPTTNLTPSTSTQAVDRAPNPSPAYTLVIPSSSTFLSWYQPSKDHCVYASIQSATTAGIWNFPSNFSERARYNVFRDLCERGYFVAGGIKFGGQYLIYPGESRMLLWNEHCVTL
ncbi:hypothetical protein AX15_003049 [Amanita polypyramis BW_CC]|nr:hypothetical protein AX15_003049 [Amanita polypyramis BW_CC]